MAGYEQAGYELNNWEAFEQQLKKLRSAFEPTSLLFRGQSNFNWPLTSTLDRSGAKGMLFTDYYRLICARVGPQVKTFSGVEVPHYDLLKATLLFSEREFLQMAEFPPDLYRYMVYLRHHGFPSPLLDWSRSPYVAAFFAFRDDLRPEVDKRSIFVYCEKPDGIKGGAVGEPTIRAIGPYVQAHHRHFRQQCDYTICGGFDTSCNQWRFESHQDVFDHRRPNQDYLWKFGIPSTERNKVLRLLNDYNLNAFSLFGSEESLMETMWIREHVLKEQAASAAANSEAAMGTDA